MSYSYTFTGAPQSTIEEYNGITKRTDYTYDERCRLISEATTINNVAGLETVSGSTNATASPSATIIYGYDALGKLISKTYGNGVTETINYNIQGWQTATEVTNGSSNIYSQQLKYYNPTKGSTPLYTGNISEWSTTLGTQAMNTYGFEYDKLGRLKNTLHYIAVATTSTNSYTERGITYDLNGNITTLKRYAASEATPEDDYQYIYTGNKLTQIAGTDNNATISDATYTYDSNGNLTHDGLKNLQISYNFLNLPSVVTQDATPVAEYSWFADGSKYRVLTQQNNGYIYTGSLIYASNNGNLQIESTDFAGGRINLVENTSTNTLSQDIQYHHKDHLGSVRAITNQGGSVVEQNAYYPFGSRHTFGNTYAQTTNRFKFNGKEEQTTGNLQYLDYGARMYDSNIGRWTTQDPLAEKYYSQSPYNYCVNNPVMFVDPDGEDVRVYIQSKGLGHTFVTTGNGKNTMLYSYGRYGAIYPISGMTSGILSPKGEGILLKGSGKPAAEYLSKVLKEGGVSIYQIPTAIDEQVDGYYNNLYNNGIDPQKPKNNLTLDQKRINEYSLLNTNCTTITIQSINNANGNIPENKQSVIMPYGIPIIINTQIISPSQLENALMNNKNVKKEPNEEIFIKNLILELLQKNEK